MKKVIGDINTIKLNELNGREVIAYRCKSLHGSSKRTYSVLSKLVIGECSGKDNWGFINLDSADSRPTYVGTYFTDALKKANAQRELMVFDNVRKLCQAIIDKDF